MLLTGEHAVEWPGVRLADALATAIEQKQAESALGTQNVVQNGVSALAVDSPFCGTARPPVPLLSMFPVFWGARVLFRF